MVTSEVVRQLEDHRLEGGRQFWGRPISNEESTLDDFLKKLSGRLCTTSFCVQTSKRASRDMNRVYTLHGRFIKHGVGRSFQRTSIM
jgi:hypothetical protein